MSGSRKYAEPGNNRSRELGSGVDEAIYRAMRLADEVRSEQAAAKAADPYRARFGQGKVRRLPAQEVASLGYRAPRAPLRPPSEPPATSGPGLRLAQASERRRAAQALRAQAKLDEINERWERRGRPKE